MKTRGVITTCLKIINVLIAIYIAMSIAMVLLSATAMVCRIVFAREYTWSLWPPISYLLGVFEVGTFFENLAYAAASVIGYSVRAVIFCHIFICVRNIIKARCVLSKNTATQIRWVGIRLAVFPAAAMFLNNAIYSYIGSSFAENPSGVIMSAVAGVLVIGFSFFVNWRVSRPMPCEEPTPEDPVPVQNEEAE